MALLMMTQQPPLPSFPRKRESRMALPYDDAAAAPTVIPA